MISHKSFNYKTIEESWGNYLSFEPFSMLTGLSDQRERELQANGNLHLPA